MEKTCIICQRPFTDVTKPKNAKTCRRKVCVKRHAANRVAKSNRLDPRFLEKRREQAARRRMKNLCTGDSCPCIDGEPCGSKDFSEDVDACGHEPY